MCRPTSAHAEWPECDAVSNRENQNENVCDVARARIHLFLNFYLISLCLSLIFEILNLTYLLYLCVAAYGDLIHFPLTLSLCVCVCGNFDKCVVHLISVCVASCESKTNTV